MYRTAMTTSHWAAPAGKKQARSSGALKILSRLRAVARTRESVFEAEQQDVVASGYEAKQTECSE